MNIHEYQAKKILSEYGIKIPKGGIAYTPTEAKKVALKASARGPWMLKAQIQSGARASGHFIEREAGHKSGIRQVRMHADGDARYRLQCSRIQQHTRNLQRINLITCREGKREIL